MLADLGFAGCGCLTGVSVLVSTAAQKHNTTAWEILRPLIYTDTETKPLDGPATVSAPQDKLWMPRDMWLFRHELFNQPNRDRDCQVVFLGDSITEQWMAPGVSLWKKKYVPEHNAINLGIGGDEVQHVLWRVQNGTLRGLSPKVLVLLIGTNNIANPTPPHKAADVAKGIRLLLDELRKQLPGTRILLLGVFPRDELPGTSNREEIAALNCIIKDYHDGKNVFYLDIGDKFMDAKQIISEDVMPDFLHLSLKGYQIWADAMDSALQRLLTEESCVLS